MEKISQQESNRIRIHRLVDTLFSVDFGSLWWVPDCLWWREYPTFVAREEGRHPGLCLKRSSSGTGIEPWPLLLGVSAMGPLKVVGLSVQHPERASHFGKVLKPGLFGASDFVVRKGAAKSESICRNSFKPCLAEDEHAEVVEFLREKGLWQES